MNGFFGRVLLVDAGSGRGTCRDLPAGLLRHCLGGVGLATRLLLENAPPGVDPLSPANPLVLAAAPLAGTALTTTAKFAVASKSPLTGFVADSLASGSFALALKRLGIDALVITGRAPAQACLVLEGDRVEVREASGLAGLSAAETEARVRAGLAIPEASVAAIGLAGERGVRFASISTEGRHAGRCGLGAVMGAKNLKAIAIRGECRTAVAFPREVERLAAAIRKRLAGPAMDTHRHVGTVAGLPVFNRLGVLPARNFQQATFDAAEAMAGETAAHAPSRGRHGCACCTIRCERRFRSARTNGQRVEYETLYALGPMCGIDDPDCVIDAAALCDHYGLDVVSTGVTVAWAMEGAEKGVLPGAAALDLRFGNGDALLAAIHAIGTRSGIGELLAEGCRRAAAATGRGSDGWAMHVKGLELPGFDPRSLKATALGLAVNPRGACHNRSGAHESDLSIDAPAGSDLATLGAAVVALEDRAAVLDSLIVCRFARACFDDLDAQAGDILSAVTGWAFSSGEVARAGERICTMKKLFNVREGWGPPDDWLPERLIAEPVATGSRRGTRLTPRDLRGMIDAYYAARQWEGRGFVPPLRIDALGLDAIAPAPA